MAITEEIIREELKTVVDPELFVNIVDLGMVHAVAIEPVDGSKSAVRIEMTLTSPMCPAGPQLISNCKRVLGRREDVASVEVKIVLDPPWTPERMTDDARDQLGIF
ncbi:MAG: metal-sulfur cluster assembly factor [Planctomycetes bacterium]|nr:metal-sulfur cluster assembly factor [Planctomycetota bacterium]